MNGSHLILVLGDQLTLDRGALHGAVPGRDTVLMAEVAEEAGYVNHNRHKIALVFAAMRHFATALDDEGFEVIYLQYGQGVQSLASALTMAVKEGRYSRVRICEPGEYRVRKILEAAKLPVPLEWVPDDRFLASCADFAQWAKGRKQLRMEYFYRRMRERYGILLEVDGSPAGGKWNYDAENRRGWRGGETIPPRPEPPQDESTREVLAEVQAAFPDNPGDLSRFCFAVTHRDAEDQLAWFIQQALPRFGVYQDALAEESPWLFHSLISMYLNIGLLDPLATVLKVQAAWEAGECELAAAEGFIRQILGWREYVRGIYWLKMPEYAALNTLQADRPLPDYFWSGETDLRCLQQALRQSLDLGYAHHIQRLMVIGNFALLAGLDVEQVCAWYLAVYVDAFEWVELPNTLGMALHGDGGIMASKPYAASGKYIQRQGDHCRSCRYSPSKVTGEGACPFNSLYWDFIERHQERFSGNPRMRLTQANWQRKPEAERASILQWAHRERTRLAGEGDRI